jgi:hypothetical protein
VGTGVQCVVSCRFAVVAADALLIAAGTPWCGPCDSCDRTLCIAVNVYVTLTRGSKSEVDGMELYYHLSSWGE